jgi:hypothetical protein
MKQFVVAPEAIDQGRRLGVGEDVATRIARMARRAAPFTHPQGNRRFEDWVLRIDKGVVLAIDKLPAEKEGDRRTVADRAARVRKQKRLQRQDLHLPV